MLLRLEKCERNRNTHLGAQVNPWRKLFPMKRLIGNFKLLSGNRQDVEPHGQLVWSGKRVLVIFCLPCVLLAIVVWPIVEIYSPKNVVAHELWKLYENVYTIHYGDSG